MHEPGPTGQSLPATHAGTPYFTAAEWENFKANDRLGGGIIVLLMGSIFTIGLFLYVGVCLSIHYEWWL
jgi:ABC-type phosphate transport system permease subunit